MTKAVNGMIRLELKTIILDHAIVGSEPEETLTILKNFVHLRAGKPLRNGIIVMGKGLSEKTSGSDPQNQKTYERFHHGTSPDEKGKTGFSLRVQVGP
jgi:hypothetical protein